MSNKHGDFIWYELMTNEVGKAQGFYRKVLGWNFTDSGQKNMDYSIASANGENVAGVMLLSDQMKANGARPCWMGYIRVDDVDVSATSVEKAGGALHMQPWDIPEVGRIAFVTDPQGAMFYLMTPARPADQTDRGSTAFSYDEPQDGHCAWNELATSDQDAAASFYTSQFGWQQKEEMDMGAMGKYKFLHHGEKMLGAMMKKPEEMPVSWWTYYFRVPDIDLAAEVIRTGGGQIMAGPMEIPGDEFMLSAADPQGAHFALVGVRQ